MSYNITFTDDNGIITVYSNTVDDAEYIDSIKARWEKTDFTKKCRYTLSDFTSVTELTVTSDGIRDAAQLCLAASKHNKSILVVAILPTDLEFGMGRMWQVYADETGWNSFPARDMKTAKEWLNENLNKNT